MLQKIFSIFKVALITLRKYKRSHVKRLNTQAFAIN
jgi:hypothetical protein